MKKYYKLKNYKPKVDNSPTKAQLKINELEKKTGAFARELYL